ARARREGRRHGPQRGAGTGPDEGSWQDAIRSVVSQPNDTATESFHRGSCPALGHMSTPTAPRRQGPAHRILDGRGGQVTQRAAGAARLTSLRVGDAGAARDTGRATG